MSHASKANWQASASIEDLQFKARLLQSLRAFFAERKIWEVDTPILSTAAITDPNLQSFSTEFLSQRYFLHTSPEFFMKRLLADGSGSIYQICKAFRDDELGRYHNAEFTLLEWYRLDFDHHQLMAEVDGLLISLSEALSSNTDWQPSDKLSYQQAFQNSLHIDPLSASAKELQQLCQRQNIEIPQGMDVDDKDMWLDWLMTQAIAPNFKTDRFTFLYDYPSSQAALAKISVSDARVAHRFEVFAGELELANGFWELQDADEQQQRFEQENQQRLKRGSDAMPIDKRLISALQSGLPNCAGVALGLDRLLMVLLQKNKLADVLSFDFSRI